MGEPMEETWKKVQLAVFIQNMKWIDTWKFEVKKKIMENNKIELKAYIFYRVFWVNVRQKLIKNYFF